MKRNSMSTKALSSDPYADFRVELLESMISTIKREKRAGVIQMGLDNFQMAVKPPVKASGPMGGNVRWWYAQTFREVALSDSTVRRFILD